MGGSGSGSGIESYDPVTKKPKLLSHPDQEQDLSSHDHGSKSMSEDESDDDSDDEYDYTTNIPKYFQWKEKYVKSDPELDQIKRKIADLRSKGFKGISFTAKSISDAYKHLHIFSDPRGFKVEYDNLEDCYEPGSDIAYLQLLKKYEDSGEIRVDKITSTWHVHKLQQGFSNLCAEDIELCFEDYVSIYGFVEVVKQWQGIQKFLLSPNSKEEYRRDPKIFEQKLKTKYGFIVKRNFNTVFQAVVKWWTDDSEQDGESASSLIDNGCKKALENHDDRLKDWWTKADYVKLKLDVAYVVGIIEKIPDEIAGFVLPGHYKWLSTKGTFDPVPYE